MLKKSIIEKTIQVSGSILLSRFLGIIREILTVQFLGVSIVSDAFLTAYKIPNSLRKIFAEGALSAAFVPTLVQVFRKQGREEVNKLILLGFIVFEGIVLMLCGIGIWKAHAIITTIAPGFSPDHVAIAVPFLQILMPFIFFLSSSALCAGALQSVHHFFIPAISPALLNVFFIASLLVCLRFSLPVTYLCYGILLGGFVELLLHMVAYFRLGFSLIVPIDYGTWKRFGDVFAKFLLCLVSMSFMEISLFVDTSFASYLPQGSISLVYYANRFTGIPLGVFAVAFSTILLPHFSRIGMYAPKRLSFYLLEVTKLVFWVTIPAALFMSFFAKKIFLTIFLSKNFTIDQVIQAGAILVAFMTGLFFFSLNKILLKLYYAMHNTRIPAFIAIVSTAVNIISNIMLIQSYQAVGLAIATSFSALTETILFIAFLRIKFKFRFYWRLYIDFVWRYCVQLTLIAGMFLFFYKLLYVMFSQLPSFWVSFLLNGYGFWLWISPLIVLGYIAIFYSRRLFGIKLYFFD